MSTNNFSSVTWRDFPDPLSKYFHIIIVNLIGFGESDKAEKADYHYINSVN
jgi:pimeloyl-ACP methyl ester carboxylesterase